MTIATAFTTLKSKRRTLTRAFAAVLAAATLLGTAACGTAQNASAEGIAEPVDGKTTKVTIGVCAGPYGDMVEEVFAPLLKEKGYEVSTKVFNDYVQPDKALASRKIDANLYEYCEGVHVSQSFQCDQSLGHPVVLCYDFDNSKVWLEMYPLLDEDDDMYEDIKNSIQAWGIHPCESWDDFNSYVQCLGEDAMEAAYYDEGGMTMC